MKDKIFPKKSYSQCGEDLLVRFIFDLLEIEKPKYIDIGAYDPSEYNNTKIFYDNGSCGINIEPIANLYQIFLLQRARDINLNIAVSAESGDEEFCIVENNKLSRLKCCIGRHDKNGSINSKVIRVKTDTIMNILNKYSRDHFPVYLTIDTEGLDYEILKSINFNIYRPMVICAETMTHSTKIGGSKKLNHIMNYLIENRYFVYADTHINTIFVDKNIWR